MARAVSDHGGDAVLGSHVLRGVRHEVEVFTLADWGCFELKCNNL
jgi:hypothetical protein